MDVPPTVPPPQNPTSSQSSPTGNQPGQFLQQLRVQTGFNGMVGMSEQAVLKELDHRERTAEARTDKKFSDMLGEMRTALEAMRGDLRAEFNIFKGATASKTTVIATGLGVAALVCALILGLAASGQQMFGLGASTRDIAANAARDTVTQVLAAQKK